MTTIKILNEKEAQVSKKFEARAKVYGTDEYREWKKFLSENPNYTMVTRTVNNAESAKFRNLTYSNMETYIRTHCADDSEAKIDEFIKIKSESIIKTNPYRFVCAWFNRTYPEARESIAA